MKSACQDATNVVWQVLQAGIVDHSMLTETEVCSDPPCTRMSLVSNRKHGSLNHGTATVPPDSNFGSVNGSSARTVPNTKPKIKLNMS